MNLNRPQQSNTILFVAAYDQNGKLLSIKTATIAKSVEMTVEDISIPAEAVTIKAMMWDRMNTMEPLCNYKTVEKGDNVWSN